MTRKEMIDLLQGVPQQITIISSPNYDGTRSAGAVFGEFSPEDLGDFCYVEWQGDHSKALRDRDKTISLWQGIYSNIDNPTVAEVLVDTLY